MLSCLLRGRYLVAIATLLALGMSGCTSVRDYVHNGFKVGPNYCPPPVPLEKHWIDEADIRVRPCEDISRWWTVFGDQTLNRLVMCAYQQNLTLREAGFRILEARATLNIAEGNLFPQQQFAEGSYRRIATPGAPGVRRFFDQWNTGFNLAWELDFWGRFRRAIAAADANLDASVAGYDDVMVSLLADVATSYIQVRTLQERIRLLRSSAEVQRGVLNFIDRRFQAGFHVTELDLDQAKSNLAQTEAAIPALQITLRQATDRLCVLMGIPPIDLLRMLGEGPIPSAPPEVAIGIPAELIRRRPDIRRAERLAAAQAELIGIAMAQFYPAFSINGTMNWTASTFSGLFNSNAFNGSVGPSFQWNILNYGRILNDVRFQDAHFQELVVTYQNTVLQAQAEVEDGLVTFLRAQEQSRLLDQSVDAANKAVRIVVLQYEKGAVDFNRYALIEQNLVQQQDSAAQSHGLIGAGLVATYRALGGGWEMRLGPPRGNGPGAPAGQAPVAPMPPAEKLPVPAPDAPNAQPVAPPAPNAQPIAPPVPVEPPVAPAEPPQAKP